MTASMTLNGNVLEKIGQEEDCSFDVEKIIKLTSLSLKTVTKASYNPTGALESTDIEQIKMSLNNYRHDCSKINEFKKELIDDLTDFQNQIKRNHRQKITELKEKKKKLERQIRVLSYSAHQLIKDRLYKIIWPYDKKTQKYHNKIKELEVQLQQYEGKIGVLEKSPPFADEKDVLIYQNHLKDKYSKVK